MLGSHNFLLYNKHTFYYYVIFKLVLCGVRYVYVVVVAVLLLCLPTFLGTWVEATSVNRDSSVVHVLSLWLSIVACSTCLLEEEVRLTSALTLVEADCRKSSNSATRLRRRMLESRMCSGGGFLSSQRELKWLCPW